MKSTIALVDLFDKEFVIPHYQRGYRWEAQEVNELLDDLWSFEKTSNKGEFYCLQPIVLQKKSDGVYNVLDGQQRLTTLYLILMFLEEMRIESGYSSPIFALDYETRANCKQFLEEKKFIQGIDDTNIDYHHITKAYATIKEWFANPKHAGARMKLIPILMDKSDKGNRNVRFIWYEAEDTVNPIDVFIRLNVGKIPLTDAELIKALLLQSDRYSDEVLKFVKLRLFEIATEWDNIEYALQNDEFWYFLNNKNNDKPTHIEFVFDLVAEKIQKEKKYFNSKPTKHATFLILSEYLRDLIENQHYSQIEAVEKIWRQVTEYFEYFKEWFHDRLLFHYVGYIIAIRSHNIVDLLIEKSNELTKTQYERYLKGEIGKLVLINKKRRGIDGGLFNVELEDLSYELEDQQTNDKIEINRILLLHNVYSSLKSDKEKSRFPFNLYKQTKHNENWSLEHIHARKSDSITKKENQKQWLRDHIKSLSAHGETNLQELIDKMKRLLDDEIDNDIFNGIVGEVYEIIDRLSDSNADNIHSISNLCLIDKPTNSLLNNSVFDVKREIIKQQELKGKYIPICTRNAFLKAYTEYPINNAYWTKDDRVAYLRSIKAVYEFFIKAINEN